ncbi:hypothetical protein H4219_002650 [Mycoemilia scoparia]|uniref:Uncharacterized protein n=1 Tax=Mycoemilia scoparia TaxID=417184 RepID=A0A9W8A0Q4_9FUNG|nr:hypothetical protein H4219_002650 [Mycoemilia scoparia]
MKSAVNLSLIVASFATTLNKFGVCQEFIPSESGFLNELPEQHDSLYNTQEAEGISLYQGWESPALQEPENIPSESQHGIIESISQQFPGAFPSEAEIFSEQSFEYLPDWVILSLISELNGLLHEGYLESPSSVPTPEYASSENPLIFEQVSGLEPGFPIFESPSFVGGPGSEYSIPAPSGQQPGQYY